MTTMTNSRNRAKPLATALIALVISGCTTVQGEPVYPATSSEPTASSRVPALLGPVDATREPTGPSPRPTGDDGTPAPEYVVNEGRASVPERGGVGCEGMPSLEPRDISSDERVDGYWYSELRDLGAKTNAAGEAITNSEGQPVAYIAAQGDTLMGIASRFCIDHYPYIEWINAIRRGSITKVTETGSMRVYPGDTINLNPYTIASVGDENGVVRDNAVEFHLPPQN